MKVFFRFLIGAGIILLILLVIDRGIEQKFREENVCYISTTSFRIYTGSDGQRMATYTFVVNGEKYEKAYQINHKQEKMMGKEIKIQYLCDNPSESRIVFDIPN